MATKTRSDTESAMTAMPTESVGDTEPKGLKDAASGVADEAGRTLETTAGPTWTTGMPPPLPWAHHQRMKLSVLASILRSSNGMLPSVR